MIAPNVAAATSLSTVGRHLDAAASRINDAVELDQTYRFRPWGMRSKVHEHLEAATTELRHAFDAMPAADAGFVAAREAVERMSEHTLRHSVEHLGAARDPAAYRRQALRGYRESAQAWASVVREGARLLSDPATTPEATRRAALDVARAIGRNATPEDLVRLAALDELPATLRPHLPVPVAGTAVQSIKYADDGGVGDLDKLLGSWERRTTMLDTPGFDRRAATEELARVLDMPDPRTALRMVAAIDQLPGHVRPDLPHVVNDWNWTAVQEYRNPGRHQAAVDALRARVDDLRASANTEPAPVETLDEVARVVGDADSIATLDDLRALRGLPGFPPALVAVDAPVTAFDVVRTRVWLDAQRLAARPGVDRAEIIAELHRALDALDSPSTFGRSGGAGSGAELADRLEGPRRVGASLSPHEALVRIAAIDHLPASLRPDLPELVGVGSRIDAAAHQSPRAFDHARDLLRLRAWASQFPHRATTTIDADVVSSESARSALRRFLDPSEADAGAPALSRGEQADVLVGALASAGSLSPRLHHGALAAAERYLDASATTDEHVRAVVDRTREMVRRNLVYTQGIDNPGFAYHPDYAELGRIAENIKLLRSFEQLDAPPAAGMLRW